MSPDPSEPRALSAEDLRLDFSADLKAWAERGETPAQHFLIGQPRALEALRMGLSIRAAGYNIFVSGQTGTGRQTAVRRAVAEQGPVAPLKDLVYVYNYSQPEAPRLLSLEPGTGAKLRAALSDCIDRLKVLIRQELKSEAWQQQRDAVVKDAEGREGHRLSQFEARMAAEGFKIVQYEAEDEDEQPSMDLLPLVEGQALSFEDLQAQVASGQLSQENWTALRERYYRHLDQLKDLFDGLKATRLDLRRSLDGLQQRFLRKTVRRQLGRVRRRLNDPALRPWLEETEADILEHLELFTKDQDEEDAGAPAGLIRYGVNVFLDRGARPTVPVVFETRPSAPRLFGMVESRLDPRSGEARSNFLMIRPGSLAQASGGYLILRVEDLMGQEEVWGSLKKALETNSAEIVTNGHPLLPAPVFLKPDPVPIQLKVIILGPEGSYDALAAQDRDFERLFKVSAEFDSLMPRRFETTREYLVFMDSVTERQGLPPLDDSGRAAVLTQGVRLAGHRDKLSTQFSQISDLLIEAAYWARLQGRSVLDERAVQAALDARRRLFSLPEERMDEQLSQGQILLDTDGAVIGQVNGLAVLDRGSWSFGRPLRITAVAGPGEDGVVNIEGEAGLSGEIHDKGMLILGGLMTHFFGWDQPFSLSARVGFEQNYGGVDGDSASSTEAYALISAIARLPLRQDLAVSGSVNQLGQIQAVGGITEKVEGFFSVCQQRGLTGRQGVILPASNVPNLVLGPEVLKSLHEGRFHLYPIRTLGEGLALLTGLPLGGPDSMGHYAHGSLGDRVMSRLATLRQRLEPKEP